MSSITLIDKEEKFPNKTVMKVLNTLKPAVFFGLERALSMLPKDKIINSEADCNSDEMKRQYRAFTRAIDRWVKEYGHSGRSLECLEIMKKAYFSAMVYEVNYQILSVYILDEYMKLRGYGPVGKGERV